MSRHFNERCPAISCVKSPLNGSCAQLQIPEFTFAGQEGLVATLKLNFVFLRAPDYQSEDADKVAPWPTSNVGLLFFFNCVPNPDEDRANMTI